MQTAFCYLRNRRKVGRNFGGNGCATQPCRFALEEFRNKIVDIFYSEHPLYIDGFGDLLALCGANRTTNILSASFASWPGHTATQIPNWLEDSSQIQISTNTLPLLLHLIFFDAAICPAIWFDLATFDQIAVPICAQITAEMLRSIVAERLTVNIGTKPCPG